MREFEGWNKRKVPVFPETLGKKRKKDGKGKGGPGEEYIKSSADARNKNKSTKHKSFLATRTEG